jgi:hypothetical protein
VLKIKKIRKIDKTRGGKVEIPLSKKTVKESRFSTEKNHLKAKTCAEYCYKVE